MLELRRIATRGMLVAVACFGMLAPRPAAAAQEVVHVEFEGAAGIVDLNLLRDGNKIVSAFAFETLRNTPWLAKTDQLTVAADGRITGTLTLTQTPDLPALQGLRGANKDAKPAPALTEEVTLDVTPKGGKVEGTIKTAATKSGLLTKADPVPVRGSVYPQAPATDSLIELTPFGVGDTFVRMRVSRGKIEQAKCIVLIGKFEPFEIPAAVGQAIVEGNTLKGAITLTKADKSPVEGIVSFEGTIIGDYAVGLATWVSGDVTDQTAFRARVSRHRPFPSLTLAARTWEPNGKPLEPDGGLAAKAREESLQPIRPGDPGKQPFYSTVLIHRWAMNERSKFFALHAPTIAFNEVPGAVKYRITAGPPGRREDRVGPGSEPLSCELEKPWMPLTQLWKEAAEGQAMLVITATGLDAAGKEIGPAEFPGKTYRYIGGDPLEVWARPEHVQKDGRAMSGFKNGVPVMKMATFAGPYWAPNQTVKEAALAAARSVRDQDSMLDFRNMMAWFGRPFGRFSDVSPAPAIFARACAAIAVLSDNPEERRDALALAERAAWMMHGRHRGKLPNVYGGNVCLMAWYGLAYLDVYAVGKDPRIRDAALDLAKTLAAAQDPEDNAWPGRDPKTGKKHWGGGVFGPSEARENSGEAMLWFLGRLRKELGVDEFVETEAKANKWVQDSCLPEMFWQNVGHHSMEMVMVQDRVAPHALSYCTWLLDYADDKDKNLKLAMEIARWCEERHVNWQRQPDPAKAPETRPSCWGWTRASGTGIRVAGSLVYIWTRLWQETKDPLWKAKADAMVQSILVSQDPVDGGLSKGFHRTSAEYTGGSLPFSYNDYDAVDATYRLMDYARLTAGQP